MQKLWRQYYYTHGMHAIAEMSHDNHVRMVCIDTYEEYTVCFTNGVANIHIDLYNNYTDWERMGVA